MDQLTQTSTYRSYQGGFFRTLISPEETGNALAILEFTLPKGAEPPPHIHTNEDETFYVLDGEINVTVAGISTLLKQGDALFAPKNIPHFFSIITEKATLLNLVSPGTLWNYFMEFSEPIVDLPGIVEAPGVPQPELMKKMLETITNTYQINFLTTNSQ